MRDIFSKSWKKELAGLRISEDLKKYTTFKIGGPADYFFTAKNKKDIIKAVGVAQDLKLPYYILGGGSNVLVADSGFRGLVIQIANQKLECRGREIHCGAGLALGALIQKSLNQGLAGLENLSGIPGTVGGAIYGNAGAFGHSIGEFIKRVEFLDPRSLKIKTYSRQDCQFGYRDSVFKKKPMIIWGASFALPFLKDQEKIFAQIKKIKLVRVRHPWRNCAGSVFKNIPVKQGDEILHKVLSVCARYGEIKIACLIEKLGLKGKRIGGAEISEKHTNFIINRGGAKAKDVLDLIDLVRKRVYKEYKLVLETEIQFVGFRE